jgi:hypothetical protein
LDIHRMRGDVVKKFYGSEGDETCGAFSVPSPIDRQPLVIVASSGGGWDHVSVSRKNRVPNWAEMEHIARLFFRDDEVAVQFHVPADDHINVHDHCLHWWRSTEQTQPLPPKLFV